MGQLLSPTWYAHFLVLVKLFPDFIWGKLPLHILKSSSVVLTPSPPKEKAIGLEPD
jgi:hypothetical protein